MDTPTISIGEQILLVDEAMLGAIHQKKQKESMKYVKQRSKHK